MYFCSSEQSWGLWPLVWKISHQGPRAYGKGLGAPLAMYFAYTGQCSFEWPSILHLVHHTFSLTCLPFLISWSCRVRLESWFCICTIPTLIWLSTMLLASSWSLMLQPTKLLFVASTIVLCEVTMQRWTILYAIAHQCQSLLGLREFKIFGQIPTPTLYVSV